jgi:hypothetical protein
MARILPVQFIETHTANWALLSKSVRENVSASESYHCTQELTPITQIDESTAKMLTAFCPGFQAQDTVDTKTSIVNAIVAIIIDDFLVFAQFGLILECASFKPHSTSTRLRAPDILNEQLKSATGILTEYFSGSDNSVHIQLGIFGIPEGFNTTNLRMPSIKHSQDREWGSPVFKEEPVEDSIDIAVPDLELLNMSLSLEWDSDEEAYFDQQIPSRCTSQCDSPLSGVFCDAHPQATASARSTPLAGLGGAGFVH